jgi:hypothetical protein
MGRMGRMGRMEWMDRMDREGGRDERRRAGSLEGSVLD